MRRVLFVWRGVRIWSYPAMLYAGLVVGVIAQYQVAPLLDLPRARVYWATMLLLPVALAGSRVLYVAGHWPEYRHHRDRIWRRGEGGLAMYGGVPIMLAASWPLLPILRLPFWSFWDSGTFCIFSGMAFARIGCFLNGCCSGRESASRVAIWLPDQNGRWARRIPVQLFEFAAALLVLAGCALALRWHLRPGTLFLGATIGYAIIRLALQGARAHRERLGALDLQQLISLILILSALAGLLLMRSFDF